MHESLEDIFALCDYRTNASKTDVEQNKNLEDTIRFGWDCQASCRKDGVSENPATPRFWGSISESDEIETAAATMRKTIGFGLNMRRQWATCEIALDRFIKRADSVGVLIMTSGIVPNYKNRKLGKDVCRVFALADPQAPFVFVNANVSSGAQVFSLAHGLVHVWLGKSGICGIWGKRSSGNHIERRCNAIAAEMLVPLQPFCAEHKGIALADDKVQKLAHIFKVTPMVILGQMREAGILNPGEYRAARKVELDRSRESEVSPKIPPQPTFSRRLQQVVPKD